MCDFNNLSNKEKLHYHNILILAANNYGGINFFLQLIEAVRDASLHPLSNKHRDFLFELGDITWNKTIFNDKVILIKTLRKEKNNGNLLKDKKGKEYKKIMNLIKTLSPITFNVKPSYEEDGEGFNFKPINMIDENTAILTPLFEAIFFCPVGTLKKILNYKV